MPSPSGCWFWLRTDQSCDRDNCLRPRHIGGLCPMHFMAACPAERAVALLINKLDTEAP